MPDNHVAIVRKSEIVGTYEEGWAKLRNRQPREGDGNFMPRTVNLVTGPSRSGDIDKTLFMGAHGPRRLHIVVVDDVSED
jgi:L-lactate dehydrogenase complex protein LldG